MNLYFVISELLTEIVCEDWSVGACHEEEYRVFGLVIARNRAQARYLIAQTDKEWCRFSDIRDMPRMSIRKLSDNFAGAARIVTDDEGNEAWWDKTDGMYPPDYRPLQEEDDG